MFTRINILFACVTIFILGSAFYFIRQSDENKIKIVLLGDSVTKGVIPPLNPDQTFAKKLEVYLRNHHFNPEIINAGVTGETADRACARLEKDIISLQPDMVIVMYGTNDAFIDKGSNSERLSLAEYKKNMTGIIEQLQQVKIPTVLMTPIMMNAVPRLNYEPYTSKGINFYLKPYVAACREIAEIYKIKLVDHFRHWEEKQNMGINTGEWLLDGIHPNAIGNDEIARTVFPVLIAEVNHIPAYKEIIENGKSMHVYFPGIAPDTSQNTITLKGLDEDLYSRYMPSEGDFKIVTRFRLKDWDFSGPSMIIGNSELVFDGSNQSVMLKGEFSGNTIAHLGKVTMENDWNEVTVQRRNNLLQILFNQKQVLSVNYRNDFSGSLGFKPNNATIQIQSLWVEGDLVEIPSRSKASSLPLVDLAFDVKRQVIIDREQQQYLGHPTTVLLGDNATMLAVYPKGHGKGEIVMKKSLDAGLTWSERLAVPESWKTSQEVPTIYRIKGDTSDKRLVLFSGLYPIRMAHSEDNGQSWSELEPVFNFGGIVAMSDLIQLKDKSYMAFFHDDGSFYKQYGKKTNEFIVYKATSRNGLSWSDPEVVVHHKTAYLCEGGVVRSPDGNQLAMLLRENRRVFNSMVIFSDDEGETWSQPVELPASLTGDRHQLIYSPDGRIVAVFRDMGTFSSTRGDFVAWVGTWEDIADGREGSYRIRLLDNKDSMDCGYPGLEVLPDGTFIATTYGHWEEGEEPYIMNVRFNLEETDALLNR